jgi:hypothetical protein
MWDETDLPASECRCDPRIFRWSPLRDNPEVSVRSRGSISATSTVRDLIETGLS